MVVLVLVVAVADAAEAGDLAAAEAEWASDDPASVVARVTIIAEACASLIRAPGSFVLRFFDPPPLPDRIGG